MPSSGNLAVIESREYRPWRVVSHRISEDAAYDLVGRLDVSEYTIAPATLDCDEFSVLYKGLDRDEAIVVPSSEVSMSTRQFQFR